MVAKNEAIVITITSRFCTWVSSWAMTPSSSAGESSSMIPVVAHTVALFGERPRAKALGIAVWATATFGLGRSACRQSRSIMAWNSGASCGETSRAPIARSASLSEVKSWSSSSPPAMTAIRIPPAPGREQRADQHDVQRAKEEEGQRHPRREAGVASEFPGRGHEHPPLWRTGLAGLKSYAGSLVLAL